MKHTNPNGLLGQGRAGAQHTEPTSRVHDWDQSFTFLDQFVLDVEWSCIYLQQYQCLYKTLPCKDLFCGTLLPLNMKLQL